MKQDESANLSLALQRQSSLAARLQGEKDGDAEKTKELENELLKMKSLENELEHLNADYQEAQQMIERNQKAAHIESQRLKQVGFVAFRLPRQATFRTRSTQPSRPNTPRPSPRLFQPSPKPHFNRLVADSFSLPGCSMTSFAGLG